MVASKFGFIIILHLFSVETKYVPSYGADSAKIDSTQIHHSIKRNRAFNAILGSVFAAGAVVSSTSASPSNVLQMALAAGLLFFANYVRKRNPKKTFEKFKRKRLNAQKPSKADSSYLGPVSLGAGILNIITSMAASKIMAVTATNFLATFIYYIIFGTIITLLSGISILVFIVSLTSKYKSVKRGKITKALAAIGMLITLGIAWFLKFGNQPF